MYISRSGFINLETMIQDIATQMLANGFTLGAINGSNAASNISASATSIVLNAGSGVDTRYQTEPWSVVFKASEADNYVSINILPTGQLNVDVAPTNQIGTVIDPTTKQPVPVLIEAGRISRDASTDHYFIHRNSGWLLPVSDSASHPISYYLSISDHGFSLCCWSEATTITGTDFSWVVAQRGVQSNLTLPSTKSPVICVFQTETSGDATTLDPACIQRFTVIEDDVGAATDPISAVLTAPDCVPIINPLQQVSITADDAVLVLYPQLYNTSRHAYFLVLDMLAYVSADVISMSSLVNVSFSTGVKNYSALLANGANNTGVRILFPMY
jgi:hypothetical protein